MSKWTYGKEGERFDVQPGQVWQVTRRHIFVCSDLMESTLLDDWCEHEKPTLMYTDPPWGQALVNGFRTKAGLQRATYTWQDLYRRVASIAHHYNIPIWAEASSEKHPDGPEVPFTLAAESHPYRDYVEIVYSRTKPCGLYYAGGSPASLELLDRLRGVSDWETPGIVMSAYDAGVVIDPCAGRGMTSRQAEQEGWHSISNELNTNRMSAALSRMSEMVGTMPERIA